ncbi:MULTISPECIES: hypothetical protein [Comamonadaceae]|uniref:ABC-type glycerol-3-phosphate transport system substrate-binding protein n=1 Tax=Variovorax boronicumulans TaxID=436515 RepID=A0AAW8E1J9_9BURK|nr:MULTISPECIES: hypothetical protein [Comamonadaceae]MDP9879824.1 ABC-type glycerol-3-phosphate transport system substrate-binding protein [Variovorax boronicumulans]MDP9914734.1 ABC-type glycerol-3-phosphate transport system substrate-binding protein [Variovorax boronicumulans]MDP9925452.1 ABC-type glycerol-3-phosphate transport system substrate-binding protein [Variovorax boronicumulans]
MKSILAALAVLATGLLVSGCAGTAPSPSSSSTSSSGSGVTVFGTIDAGVSGTTNKSSR